MDVTTLVKDHYSGDDLAERALAAVGDAGGSSAAPSWQDLADIDNLHAGGLPATRHLLSILEISPTDRLVDVGCGIGGTARCAAADHGCQVVGVDLSPDFVRAATVLTERVGLAALAGFATTSGDLSPLGDGEFDRATLVHVGMNVPDKAALFAEVHRVLRPGGRFGVYEQMRLRDAELTYPLPWAEDDRSSFVASVDEYETLLRDAGFTIDVVQNRTAEAADGSPGGLGPGVIFGPGFATRVANNIAATRGGKLGAVLIAATRP